MAPGATKSAARPPPPRKNKAKTAAAVAPQRSAADAKGLVAGNINSSNKALLGEDRENVDRIFGLSDKDGSGSIDFDEFMWLHKTVLSAAGLGHGTSQESSEEQFRDFDKDGSLTLDRQEWTAYMLSVQAVIGRRLFAEMSKELYEESVARKKAFDKATSEQLHEKIRSAHRVLPGMYEAIDGLLAKRADVNYCDATGTSTFMYAAEKSETDFVDRLLAMGASPHIYNKDMDSAVFSCSRASQIEVLGRLLLPGQQGPADGGTSFKASQQLVRDMASMPESGVVAALRRGADPNYRDPLGMTPLTAAAFWGREDCAAALISSTPVVCQPKKAGGAKPRVVVDMFNMRGRSPIHLAARKGNAGMVEILLKARACVDCQDADGWTPLHHAVFNGMASCIMALVDRSADLQVEGRSGMTPPMIAKDPECSGALNESCAKRLEVPIGVCFAKAILPILKEETTVFGRVDRLLGLPGVHRSPLRLRLYEQCFDSRRGPNKVRLQKLWETLALPLLRRLHSSETDMNVQANIADDDLLAVDRQSQVKQRLVDSASLLRQWLLDTRGPRPTESWSHANREVYEPSFGAVVEEELSRFASTFDALYAEVPTEPGGMDLVGRPWVEIKEGALTSQLQAHVLLPWLQSLDTTVAFDFMRSVGALPAEDDGTSGADCAVVSFLNLVRNDADFSSAARFWCNVYPLWLAGFAKLAEGDFVRRVGALVSRFKATVAKEDASQLVEFRSCSSKSYEGIKRKASSLGEVSGHTYEGRVRAAAVLDVVRCSITVNSPRLATRVLDDIFEPLRIDKSGLQLLKIDNRFSDKADVQHAKGYRNLILTVLFDGGHKPSPCGRKDVTVPVRVIGEVQVHLNKFLGAMKRRSLLWRAYTGEFDWPAGDDFVAHKAGLADDDEGAGGVS